MATTNIKFLTNPANTVQGYTLAPSSPYGTATGIQVGLYDANGNLQTTDTTAITIAIGTNPTSGSTLSGTLTVTPVAGIATFKDLAITLGGVGYTLSATYPALSAAVSNTFTLASLLRINPAEIHGTITATGDANSFGPYRYRAGSNVKSVRISGQSTNSTDVCKIIFVEPGQTLGTNLDEVPSVVNYTATSGLTCPFSVVLDGHEMGGQHDIYVVGTTVTGTITVKVQRSNG